MSSQLEEDAYRQLMTALGELDPDLHNSITAMNIASIRIRRLEMEKEKLKAIIEQHDLCHNLHGKVGAREFADGCAQEQRKLYGEAPDADRIVELEKVVKAAKLLDLLWGQESFRYPRLDAPSIWDAMDKLRDTLIPFKNKKFDHEDI